MLTLRFWAEVLSSVGYGVLSSVVPIFHTEAFIIASLAAGVLGVLPLTIGLTIGQTIGKQLMFLAVRHGKQLPVVQQRKSKPLDPNSWRARWKSWSERTAHLVESPRWGYPLLFISGAVGVPPIYLVTLFAGATRMSFVGFSVVAFLGFFVRTLGLALITLGAVQLW